MIVAGAGPAGLMTAGALARVGVDVLLIAPDPARRWVNRYATWVRPIEAVPHLLPALKTFERTSVVLGDADSRRYTFDEPYGVFDNDLLMDTLRADLSATRLLDDAVIHVAHDDAGTSVTTRASNVLRCKLLIDATGARTHLSPRHGAHRATAFQTAYGVLARTGPTPFDDDTMTLMDYSAPTGLRHEVPTFLYSMACGEGLRFFEETTLIAAPAYPIDALERRLRARLDALDVELIETIEVERCFIPMNLPLPDTSQRTVAVGGASSFVHPATGYQVAYAARRIEALAQTLEDVINLEPERLSTLAWESLWPQSALRRHAMLGACADTLLTMDEEETRGFFDAFFQLPIDTWMAFLTRECSLRQLSATMARIYALAPPVVRRRLRSAGGLNTLREVFI